ncbi:hypothetical protein EYF80_038542 [Liparis tanakae]|uniref:Uncharacterized protein n=1 Tax=Liparis tanakae TaxID=230148 RepID=A0A4Z2GEW9_9TELE|nr:hypothetical protein EYF80_038542 [Liparis tanakae]
MLRTSCCSRVASEYGNLRMHSLRNFSWYTGKPSRSRPFSKLQDGGNTGGGGAGRRLSAPSPLDEAVQLVVAVLEEGGALPQHAADVMSSITRRHFSRASASATSGFSFTSITIWGGGGHGGGHGGRSSKTLPQKYKTLFIQVGEICKTNTDRSCGDNE